MAIIRPARDHETPTGRRARTPIVTTHAGLVADVTRLSSPAGELIVATLFDPETGRFERVPVVAVNDPQFKAYRATVDVCEEIAAALIAARIAVSASRAADAAVAHAQRAVRARAAVAETPRRGARVEVIGGDRLPIGLTGRVFWAGSTPRGLRVGLDPDDGGASTFVDAVDLRVIAQPADVVYPGIAPQEAPIAA